MKYFNKIYFKNFLIFTIFFISIYVNMAFIPSVINDKHNNINALKNLLSMRIGKDLKKVKYS